MNGSWNVFFFTFKVKDKSPWPFSLIVSKSKRCRIQGSQSRALKGLTHNLVVFCPKTQRDMKYEERELCDWFWRGCSWEFGIKIYCERKWSAAALSHHTNTNPVSSQFSLPQHYHLITLSALKATGGKVMGERLQFNKGHGKVYQNLNKNNTAMALSDGQ